MKFLPRKENRAERKAKAFKATEMGIAGHEATMKALTPRIESKLEANVIDRHKPTEDF